MAFRWVGDKEVLRNSVLLSSLRITSLSGEVLGADSGDVAIGLSSFDSERDDVINRGVRNEFTGENLSGNEAERLSSSSKNNFGFLSGDGTKQIIIITMTL